MMNRFKIMTTVLSVALAALSGCDPDDFMDNPVKADEVELDGEGKAMEVQDSEQEVLDEDGTQNEVSEERPDGPDEFSDALEPSAASCVGYFNGGNFCLASCWDKPGVWIPVGHVTNTVYGQCSSKVNNYCAWHAGTYGACWGRL